jgi:hypothetical protein
LFFGLCFVYNEYEWYIFYGTIDLIAARSGYRKIFFRNKQHHDSEAPEHWRRRGRRRKFDYSIFRRRRTVLVIVSGGSLAGRHIAFLLEIFG